MSKTPTYESWCGMRKRCENVNCKSYKDYGGRDIKVCARWRKFENFLADMGVRPSLKHELTRIDNDGNYTSENVEWSADASLQNLNRRAMGKSKFRGVDFWGGKGWRARIHIVGKGVRYLGLFDTEEEAARSYDEVARSHRGMLNFPEPT